MKRRYPNIMIEPSFWIFTVLALVVIPVKWILAWLIAVMIHELGHYIGLRIFQIQIYSVSVKTSGAYIHAAPMTMWQEAVVAGMGPCASVLLILLSRWFPRTAICALIQLLFNLLPVNDYDGERILRNFLMALLPTRCASLVLKCLDFLTATALCVGAVILTVCFDWGILPLTVVMIVLLRGHSVTFSCKRRKQIVQ